MISAGGSRFGARGLKYAGEACTPRAPSLHCSACGARAPVETRLGWLCSDCGYELCEGRCGSCGKRLERCVCDEADWNT